MAGMLQEIFERLFHSLDEDKAIIDSTINKLHYRVTSIILMLTGSVFSGLYFGNAPISCSTSLINPEAVNNYCWIGSNFVRNTTYPEDIYQGVGPISNKNKLNFQKFYLWIPIFLLLQGAMFNAPRVLWSNWENGRIRVLVQDLRLPVIETTSRLLCLEGLVRYLKLARGKHFVFGLQYIFCELLYLANIAFQIFLTDFFLDHQFSNYGIEVMRGFENQIDPLDRIFPKVTKCSMATYGPSGTVQTHDSLCALHLNIYFDKFFLIVWFWFMFLAVITSVNTAYRIALIFEPRLRSRMIEKSGGRSLDRELIDVVLGQHDLNAFQSFGEWVILHLIISNLDALTVKDLFKMLGKAVDVNRMGSNLEF